jgi:uncharacterized membrane protein
MTKQALGLAALLGASGALHFLKPRPYDSIVPRSLPSSRRTWTYMSGAAELAVAAAIVLPRTRRVGGLAAAALFVGVFPANVKMAVDWRKAPPARRAIAFGRLPLQIPLVLWARKVANDS